jgi:hypothetical protein
MIRKILSFNILDSVVPSLFDKRIRDIPTKEINFGSI